MTTTQIQSIIDALKTAGGNGWNALVSQQLTTGWIGMFTAAFFLFVALVTIVIATAAWHRTNWESNDKGVIADIVFLIAVVVATFCVIFATSLFFVDLNQVINPNGAAITQLVKGL